MASKKLFIRKTKLGIVTTCLVGIGLMSSCCSGCITTDDGGKYSTYIEEYHYSNFFKGIDAIESGNLSLYVDYSTCNVLGQNSAFYQALVPSWTAATKNYYSIKGTNISKEDGRTYELLKTIQEVNYAELKNAIEQMANSKSESVLLTDGEYFEQTEAKGHVNDPYMANALKIWLQKGHDIFVFSEPYVEPDKGQSYNKKRFYIIFTDVRLRDNIYDRITQTVKLQDFPDVEMFHLSADHPSLAAEGTSTKPNENLGADVNGFGPFEAQEWSIDWKNGIEPLIVYAVNPQTGNPLPDGESFTGGLKVDRNSFGGYRITDVAAKVYNINQEFTDFCAAKQAGQKYKADVALTPLDNFIKLDEKEFQKHGIINLYFNVQMFTPDPVLNGSPFNFTKIDICVSGVQDMFSQFDHQFEFESIDMPGQTNTSVAESIKQCLADPDIKTMISTCPIYTIYIKTPER